MNTDTVDQLVGAYVQNEKGQYEYGWKGCKMSFPSPVGVRMHRIRAHIKPWSTTKNFKGRGNNPQTIKGKKREEKLAQQRIYNARMRARYIARGLNSAGKPRKSATGGRPPSSTTGIPLSLTKEYRDRKYREQVDRYHAKGLNAHGQPFKNNNISHGMRKSIAKGIKIGPQPKRLPYVYPVPQAQPAETTPTPTPTPEWIHAQLHFCPHCGEKLTSWKKE